MANRPMKSLTFSYDDGVTQDVRLIEIFNKYGLKATFNLNSELLGNRDSLVCFGKTISHIKNRAEDVRHIYDGHEIASHTLTHPKLTKIADDGEIIRQVEEDRLRLSELAGYEVVGMAYPCGGQNSDDRVAEIIRNHTGIKYARVLFTSGSFDPYPDLYQYKGTYAPAYDWDALFQMGRRFLELPSDKPAVFYIWGHSYEFDIYPERWEIFDEFCKMMSGHSDVFYGTNREVLLSE
ncbi:MAG: polysaccharide deacetylase family protein [Clostridia bacterium]|nr:polysaccharide deacetylase family protein [Clostridia bacterium]